MPRGSKRKGNPSSKPSRAEKVRKVAGKITDVANVVSSAGKAVGLIAKMVNHPEWYTHYTESALVALNFGIRKDLPVTRGLNEFAVPSVVALPTIITTPATCITPPTNTTQPVYAVDSGYAQGISRLYKSLRAANSSTSPYPEGTLYAYVHTVRTLHAIYAAFRTLYAAAWNFDVYDARMPGDLIKALGFDPEDVRNHLADIRMFGNNLGIRIATNMPLKNPIIDRTRWLFSNVFADSNDAKASYYVFKYFTNSQQLQFNPATEAFEGFNFFYFGDVVTTMRMINQLVDAWITYEPFSNVAAEMLKAFGNSCIYPAEIWPESMAVPMVYDEAALTQIQNAFWPDASVTLSGIESSGVDADHGFIVPNFLNVRVDPEQGQATPSMISAAISAGTDRYINTYKDSMSPGETMSAMRLTSLWKHIERGSAGDIYFYCVSYGTEIVTGVDFIPEPTTDNSLPFLSFTSFNGSTAATFAFSAGSLSQFASAMDWCPRMSIFALYINSTTSRIEQVGYLTDIWDYNNYAHYPEEYGYISQQNVANASLLYVPFIVKQAKWDSINVGNER